MKFKKTLISSQYLASTLVVGSLLSSIFYHDNAHIARPPVAVAQSVDDCSVISQDSLGELPASDQSADFNTILNSCLNNAYARYSNSIEADFIRPLEVIVSEAPERRDEEFVSETAGLNLEEPINDFRDFQSLVRNAIETVDGQEVELTERLTVINRALDSVEDTIITPLLLSDYNTTGIHRVFVYGDDESAETIERIQQGIPALEADPGVYGQATFAGIVRFFEDSNSTIESLLGEDTAVDSSEVNDSPGEEENSGYVSWLILLCSGLAFLLLTVLYRKKESREKTETIKAKGDTSREIGKPQRTTAVVERPEEPFKRASNTAVLSIADALTMHNTEYLHNTEYSTPKETATSQYNSEPEKDETVKLKCEPQPKPVKHRSAIAESVKSERSLPQTNQQAKPQPSTSKNTTKAPSKARLMFSFSKSELINQYNNNAKDLESGSYAVDQTNSSTIAYFHGSNSTIEIENKSMGKYWLIPTTAAETVYYLVLRKDISLNAQSIDAISACFAVENRGSAKSDFELITPAIVQPITGRDAWELTKKGEIRFLEEDNKRKGKVQE